MALDTTDLVVVVALAAVCVSPVRRPVGTGQPDHRVRDYLPSGSAAAVAGAGEGQPESEDTDGLEDDILRDR